MDKVGVVSAALVLALAGCAVAEAARPGRGRAGHSGAVAADHILASEAGAAALRAGGNAVDAAIAAALASGVVQPSGSGLGGGGFAVVVKPDGVANAFDFREVAPAAASATMFAGGVSSQTGGLAVAVPSEALGLIEMHHQYGRLPLRRIALPAIHDAERGFETGPHLAESLAQFPGMHAVFGEHNERPGLALALRAFADSDGEAFRTGWVAQDFVDTVRANGGVLTMDDFLNYTVKPREPLRGAYHGLTVVTMPPPSSGGIALLQMLGATDGVSDLACEVEAAKHAMADRAAFGGDPQFVPVDVAGLLSAAHVAQFRADCGPTTFPPEHYAPVPPPPDDHGTLHISVIDGDGMAVALTTTINTAFGSQLVAARSGIVLNNEMDDFATHPGQANAYGLIQGDQNAPLPGKRPLSSMTPTVILDASGRPFIAVGGSGGPFIITATYQAIRNVVDRGMDAAAAVSAPRWHHQWLPNVVMAEGTVPAAEIAALTARGHTIAPIAKPFSAVQLVIRRDGQLSAASDPRKGGTPVLAP